MTKQPTNNLNNFIIRDIFAVNDINQKKVNFVTTRKNRPFYSLSMKVEGETTYLDDKGQSFVANKDTVILISKGSNYRWSCKKLGQCIAIELVADYDGPSFSFMEFKLNEKNRLEAYKFFNRINRYWKEKKEAYPLKCKAMAYEILSCISTNQEKSYVPKSKMKLLQPAVDHMTMHMADPSISNEELASLCNISVVYFRKLFEKTYGISPIRFLKMIRIEKAKELLASDYLSISHVASVTGFNSIYSFSRVFKNEVGMSPKSYIDKMGKGL